MAVREPRWDTRPLAAAGIAAKDINAWLKAEPLRTRSFAADCKAYSAFWRKSTALLAQLPPPARRQDRDRSAAITIDFAARDARARFLYAHADAVYDKLTAKRTRHVRIEELAAAAAKLVPNLVPSHKQIAAEDGLKQSEKAGLEIDQGLFVSAMLRSRQSGTHLCHAMLLPRQEAYNALPRYLKSDKAEFPGASIERRGKAAILTYRNPRFLNAEDQTTLDGFETCVDLALLDGRVEVAVLRGGIVENPKYAGRRLFGSGINLTHLYHGRIPFLWYLTRDLGYVNKLYRGIAVPHDAPPDEFGGQTIEKPFIAAVEGFAIGGHCQVLLAVDYVIAEKTAFMTLPARKEGIIPGAANMRLPRAVGDRVARQAIQYERRLECDSPEGRLICDEIVEAGAMDAAIERVVKGLTSSGVVSAASNRRAFRITQEPLDMFRNYFSVYAREQAYCHFSPALISNLERYWDAANRKP
ncbi:MAG: enoyl-CoA hydratase/isomerase family protein [Alphaproteobacteria bacterium]|nr:enoyl-CoA hydratase/isomerase family protein [Alphaproteobacteria bacterium]